MQIGQLLQKVGVQIVDEDLKACQLLQQPLLVTQLGPQKEVKMPGCGNVALAPFTVAWDSSASLVGNAKGQVSQPAGNQVDSEPD